MWNHALQLDPMALRALFHLVMVESPTSTAAWFGMSGYFGNILQFLLPSLIDFLRAQNWCVTENGWGICANTDCRGGVPGCFKTNVEYSPLNFPGARRSVEISAEACKARCKEDPDCGFFSFWEKDLPKDNGCTLFGDDTVFGDVKETKDYISGPAKCPGMIVTLRC